MPEISGGGYFFDLGCHQIDILDFLLGPITSISGEFSNRANLYSAEDSVVACLKFQSGIIASCCWCYVGDDENPVDRIEIFGTRGRLAFSISTIKPIEVYHGKEKESFTFNKPKHIQIYMIDSIVKCLLGKEEFQSNRESAARTSWAMDKILKRIPF
jgi:predicted dehydrogenase